MTQEEKAKAYDELKVKASRIYHKENDVLIMHTIEDLFPELKESDDERIRKNLIGYIKGISKNEVCEETKDSWIVWLEKQGEQKPVYKPKFHEGDWVVSPNGVYWHIDAIQDGRYQVSSDSGKCADWPLDTNIYHRFTLQDAKDGDILFHSDSASNGIFLFKEIRHDGKVLCYCDYDSEDHFCLGEHHTCCWANDKILHPATKEQRDTLMKAMADAGYTFDFEKKELKKIEQKSATIDIDKMVDDYANNKERGNEEFGKPVNCMIKAYRQGLIDAIGKVMLKPTWSEEDDIILSRIIADYERSNKEWFNAQNSLPHGKKITWLKSLKDRVQLKPKQEWNEEDEDILNTIINHFEIDLECTENDDIIRWLKSLRPQNKWKPSEGQLECLGYAIEKAEIDWTPLTNNRIYLTLKALKEDLEKL